MRLLTLETTVMYHFRPLPTFTHLTTASLRDLKKNRHGLLRTFDDSLGLDAVILTERPNSHIRGPELGSQPLRPFQNGRAVRDVLRR